MRSVAGTTVLCVFAISMVTLSIFTLRNVPVSIANVLQAIVEPRLQACISSFSDEHVNAFAVTYTDLNNDKINDAFVQYTKGDACGTKGCIYELCLNAAGSYVHIPLHIAGNSINTTEVSNYGMKDIIINNDPELILNWDKDRYVFNEN